MADTGEDSLSLYDLLGKSPKEAGLLVRARAAELERQRDLARIAMHSSVPEAQQAGEADYVRAEAERKAGAQEMPGFVLHQALQQKYYEKEMAALQQQIEYQRASLGLQGAQLHAEIMRPFLPAIMQSKTRSEQLNALGEKFGGLAKKITDIAKLPVDAQTKALQEMLGESVGNVVPKAPPAKTEESVPMKTPQGDVVPVPKSRVKEAIKAGGVVVGGGG